MITIFKSGLTQTVHIGTISSSPADDYNFIRDGEYFEIFRGNTDIPDVVRTHYTMVRGKKDDSYITFSNYNELESYLNDTFIVEKSYCPKPYIDNVSLDYIVKDSNTELHISGEFLDQTKSIEVEVIEGNPIVEVINIEYDGHKNMKLTISCNDVLGKLRFKLIGDCGEVSTGELNIVDVITIVPNISGDNLWYKNSNNSATLSEGYFSAEDNQGNGWNDSAYFGGISSDSRVDFEMTINKLQTNYGAYSFIRLSNDNFTSTSGNPRLYINNGSNLYVYNYLGIQTVLPSIKVGDNIKVSLTDTFMIVYINDIEVYTDYNSYNITNLYVTFTAYRVFTAENIKLTIFNPSI